MSLVLMCPSMLMQLNVSSITADRAFWAVAGVSGASVSTRPSIVPMRGAIMAAPLHMPASWIVRPASDKLRPASL